MKKALLSMIIGVLVASLLSSCEAEQITPKNRKDTPVLFDTTPPAGGGPTGDIVAAQKADTLIVK
jgi:hypothetical protein